MRTVCWHLLHCLKVQIGAALTEPILLGIVGFTYIARTVAASSQAWRNTAQQNVSLSLGVLWCHICILSHISDFFLFFFNYSSGYERVAETQAYEGSNSNLGTMEGYVSRIEYT